MGVGAHCIYMCHTRVWAHITLAAETGDIKMLNVSAYHYHKGMATSNEWNPFCEYMF